MTWPFPEPTMDQLVEQMNRTHPTIRFTSEKNPQCISFLNVSVYKGQDFQYTKHLSYETYLKPTNKQLHVHTYSYHPMSTKEDSSRVGK